METGSTRAGMRISKEAAVDNKARVLEAAAFVQELCGRYHRCEHWLVSEGKGGAAVGTQTSMA